MTQANGVKRKRAEDAAKQGAPKEAKPNKSSKSASKQNTREDHAQCDGRDGVFKGYKLDEIPKEAWPRGNKNLGSHGYTIKASNNAVLWTHKKLMPQKCLFQVDAFLVYKYL